MTERHLHEWTETDTPGALACTLCPATATTCHTPRCDRILTTTGRVCDRCVSLARNDLRDVRDLYRQLPDVIAATAGLHAVRYDQRGTTRTLRPTDTTIIGGAAFVLAGPGNPADRGLQLGRHETTETIATLAAAEQHDPPSVLGVLTGWEDAWRTELGHPAADVTTVDAAVDYLLAHTEWAAQHSGRWDEYRRDIRSLRHRLRVLTGNDRRPVKAAAPCPFCGGDVVQHWRDPDPSTGDRGGLDDTRVCAGTRRRGDDPGRPGCGVSWATEAHFLLAIRQAHESLPETHPDELVTLDDAARILRTRGVRPNLLRLWEHRDRRDAERYAAGDLTDPPTPRLPEQHGTDVRGRALYRLGDLTARALAATEKGATP